VKIVNNEEAVRSMQIGHGGWNNQMKNVGFKQTYLPYQFTD